MAGGQQKQAPFREGSGHEGPASEVCAGFLGEVAPELEEGSQLEGVACVQSIVTAGGVRRSAGPDAKTSSLDGNFQVCRLLAVAVVSSHGLFASAPFSVMRQSGLMASPTQWT